MSFKKTELKTMIRQAVLEQLDGSFVNEGPRHGSVIQKGMDAGAKAAGQRSSGSRYGKGEMAQQAKDSAKRAKQRKARAKRFKSTSDYLVKVFGNSAKVYSNNTVDVAVGQTHKVRVALEPRESVAGAVFVVSILGANNQVTDTQELGVGIGAKQKIARFIKKVQQQVNSKMKESKSNLESLLEQVVEKKTRLTKTQLKEMVRKVVRKQLNERSNESGGMSHDELTSHLEKERERKKRVDAQKKRAGSKQSMRGMSVECGPDMGHKHEPRKLSVLFMDDERDLEEGMYEGAGTSMDDFCSAYIEAILEDSPGDNYTVDDIDQVTLWKMEKDCDRFQELAGEMIEGREERAGYDFWHTRNGHGAGFWDGDWPEHGDALTELSEKFGEVSLYGGDDGKIHQW